MHEGDVDAVYSEPLQTVFNGASNASGCVVVDDVVRRGRERKILFTLRCLRRLEELTHLRGGEQTHFDSYCAESCRIYVLPVPIRTMGPYRNSESRRSTRLRWWA